MVLTYVKCLEWTIREAESRLKLLGRGEQGVIA